MISNASLENLTRSGQLRKHEATPDEIRYHIGRARNLLEDARKKTNSLDGRFNNAYGAGHALLMAAIKMRGYRPADAKGHRLILYQLINRLLPAAAAAKSILEYVHGLRNRSEYDGDPIDVTQGLVDDLIAAVDNVRQEVDAAFRAWSRTTPAAPAATRNRRGK